MKRKQSFHVHCTLKVKNVHEVKYLVYEFPLTCSLENKYRSAIFGCRKKIGTFKSTDTVNIYAKLTDLYKL